MNTGGLRSGKLGVEHIFATGISQILAVPISPFMNSGPLSLSLIIRSFN